MQWDGRFQAGEQWGQGAPQPRLNLLPGACAPGEGGTGEIGPESIFASSSSWGLMSNNFPSSSLCLIHSLTHSLTHSFIHSTPLLSALRVSLTEDEVEIGRLGSILWTLNTSGETNLYQPIFVITNRGAGRGLICRDYSYMVIKGGKGASL